MDSGNSADTPADQRLIRARPRDHCSSLTLPLFRVLLSNTKVLRKQLMKNNRMRILFLVSERCAAVCRRMRLFGKD